MPACVGVTGKRPLDYFKQDFYADSAVFGSRAATVCGLEFYGADRVVFASDCPFDPEGGTGYIRATIAILDSLDLSKQDRENIYWRNLERLTGHTFASQAASITRHRTTRRRTTEYEQGRRGPC